MTRTARFALAGAILALGLGGLRTARAQNQEMEVPDTVFIAQPREPVSFYTTYDRDLSRGSWLQSLSYTHSSKRFAFTASGNMNTIQGLRGLESDGKDGDINGRLDLRATNRWIWTLDGRFNMSTRDDQLSSTDRRRNRMQIRTQYTLAPSPQLVGVGILSTEFQEEQSIGNRAIPRDTLRVPVDTTAVPPVYDVFASHSARDSSSTTGRRDGVSGTLTWRPAAWLETKGLASATEIRSTTKTVRREFWAPNPGEGASLELRTRERSEAPNGDRRYEARATYTGLKRTTLQVQLKNYESDQQYYALARRAQEHLAYDDRSGSLHIEHSPLSGAQITIDGTRARSLREYVLQKNLNSLVNSDALTTNFVLSRPETRATLGFQLSRARSDRQITQNGTIINRALTGGAAKRATDRLWLDGNASISLYSRKYDDEVSDRDDVRSYVSVGGGYLASPRCSTTVHFSTGRTHAVAIDPSASGGNNVQTTYQMDATMKLQVSQTFSIYQTYQINANYLIYDYDEPRNTLTRIRRIDTTLSDSLFSSGFIRLTHNFFFQDRGPFTQEEGEDHRTYAVAQELYQQNVGLTAGIRPFPGIVFSATQTLANTRNYFPTPSQNTKKNRWGLNIGVDVDRELSGQMALRGTIRHLGEYTERVNPLQSTEPVDYWLAGLTFSKEF